MLEYGCPCQLHRSKIKWQQFVCCKWWRKNTFMHGSQSISNGQHEMTINLCTVHSNNIFGSNLINNRVNNDRILKYFFFPFHFVDLYIRAAVFRLVGWFVVANRYIWYYKSAQWFFTNQFFVIDFFFFVEMCKSDRQINEFLLSPNHQVCFCLTEHFAHCKQKVDFQWHMIQSRKLRTVFLCASKRSR